MKHTVECYSGLTYAERPTVVHWQGQRLAVEQVLRSWRTPQGPGFDVIVADGRSFRLFYEFSQDHWDIFMSRDQGKLSSCHAHPRHHLA